MNKTICSCLLIARTLSDTFLFILQPTIFEAIMHWLQHKPNQFSFDLLLFETLVCKCYCNVLVTLIFDLITGYTRFITLF